LKDAGRQVIAIGKIGDIYAHQGVTDVRKANGNMALFDKTLAAMDDAKDGDLVFTNFVDFDMLFGHRRDVPGYANALEQFDRRLPEIMVKLKPGDLMVLTADHGCDPTWRGTDHTRERVPVLMFGPGIPAGSAGIRATFADIGETVAAHLGLAPGPQGTAYLSKA
jgi:phosphopentomutase